MVATMEAVLPVQPTGPRLTLLTEQEMTGTEGGGLWAGVGVILGAGLLACVLGAGVGVALYCMSN